MKTLYDNKKWHNPHLPLMPAPNATFKEFEQVQTCSYCGGRVTGTALPKPERINGKRIPVSHKDCIASAKNPLFDMPERKLGRA